MCLIAGVSTYYLTAAHAPFQPLLRETLPLAIAEALLNEFVRPMAAEVFKQPLGPAAGRARLGVWGTPSEKQLRWWVQRTVGAAVAERAYAHVELNTTLAAACAPAQESRADARARHAGNKRKKGERAIVLLHLLARFTYGMYLLVSVSGLGIGNHS